MRNPYLKQLNKIEFVVTYACTGRCKHCSEGDHSLSGERIDPSPAADAVRAISAEYDIGTVMTFGGEPLLHPDVVYEIMRAARESNVPHRQLITNGFFTRDRKKMREVAERLRACAVNDLLLSVDAFHQESIPLAVVRAFAEEAVGAGLPVRLQPAWLVSEKDDNPYNRRTRELLESFRDLELAVGTGNIVFPEGNARLYLSEYFTDQEVQNPYEENPRDVRCISFDPEGGVLGDNFYRRDIMEIIRDYTPVEDK